MKYTYRAEAGTSDALYLKFSFDRQLSDRYRSRGSSVLAPHTPELRDLMEAVARTRHVIASLNPIKDVNYSELIVANGSELTVKCVLFPTAGIPELANQIVKKVQRRFAKGEPRRRIKQKELQAELDRVNENS